MEREKGENHEQHDTCHDCNKKFTEEEKKAGCYRCKECAKSCAGKLKKKDSISSISDVEEVIDLERALRK